MIGSGVEKALKTPQSGDAGFSGIRHLFVREGMNFFPMDSVFGPPEFRLMPFHSRVKGSIELFDGEDIAPPGGFHYLFPAYPVLCAVNHGVPLNSGKQGFSKGFHGRDVKTALE